MTVRYNRKRLFQVWQLNGTYYAVETKYLDRGKLTVPYSDCLSASTKDEIIDKIETQCKFDELLENGMSRAEAASLALFGE